MNPALQYRNYGKSLKHDLNRGPQYRKFENAKKKVIDSIAFLRPPGSDRTTVSQKLSFCTSCYSTTARRRFEGFGQNPSRTEGKSMVFTTSGSDLPYPCGDARLARGSMSLMNLVNFGSFGGSASVFRGLTRRCGARRICYSDRCI